MNEKVAKLINDEKSRLNALEKERRDEHLVSLGLIDKSKTRREYLNSYGPSAKYDSKKKLYYQESIGAQDVTREEYEEICKYFPPQAEKEVKTGFDQGGFKTLKGFAFFFMICAIIFTLVTLVNFVGFLAADRFDKYTKLIVAGYSLFIALVSLLSGAICQGLSVMVKTALMQGALLEKEYRFVT